MHVLVFVNLFCAGLLAGMEVVVRFGVRGPLIELGQVPQIQIRQGLIRTLRVLVPSVYVPTLATGVLVAVLEGAAPGMVPRIVGGGRAAGLDGHDVRGHRPDQLRAGGVAAHRVTAGMGGGECAGTGSTPCVPGRR